MLSSVKDVEPCRLARHNPADTAQVVSLDIHASLAKMTITCTTMDISMQLTANYVNHRLVHGVSPKFNPRPKLAMCKNGRKCLICKKPGCWPSNHPAKDHLNAYKKNKLISQFFAVFRENNVEFNDGEVNVTEAVEEIVVLFI